MYSKYILADPYSELLSSMKRNQAAPGLLTKNDLQDILGVKKESTFQYCMNNIP